MLATLLSELAMTGYGTIVIVSIYLLPSKALLRSDLKTLFALGDAVILFGDFNCKHTDWRCPISNTNGRFKSNSGPDAVYGPMVAHIWSRPSILHITLTKGVSLKDPINHVRTVVERSSWVVLVTIDRRKLPADASKLLRVKNAGLRCAHAYPAAENSVEYYCSHTLPPHDIHHIQDIEEEVRQKISLEPQDDQPPVSFNEVQKLVKNLKTNKAPGLDGISNKAIKCFPLQLLSLLTAIFNVCLKNCHFPPIWKEAEVNGIHKPGKPSDLVICRPISFLSGLGKLYEKILKARLSEHLFGNGLIINEQFGFRLNHF
ncbi:Probable RNA-directed DNA polymerase from transposon X-element [Eumeta japonica]|uniref:Probable RNA-directed DNA polymerase from transposon X-element n=1 Tax=Eumeta variegata TaxID=151549 RepID=A0A4C1WNL3_EUMVA|nr:Probable RNA-directed DNA polymerase from transposon X-element [Eumeta japonica]